MDSTERLPRVLFLCTHNSSRSQMAEGLLRSLGAGRVEALSAGTEPLSVRPEAAAVMGELGIDLSGHRAKAIDAYLEDPPDLVITVCDSSRRLCPTFPGSVRRLHWPFPDPTGHTGTQEEVEAFFRDVRDRIKLRIETWLQEGMAPLVPVS